MISEEKADLLNERLSNKYSEYIHQFKLLTKDIYEGDDFEQRTLFIQSIYLKDEYVGKQIGRKIMNDIFDFCYENDCNVTLYWDTEGGQKLEDLWREQYGFEYYQTFVDKYGMRYVTPDYKDNLLVKEVTNE